MKISQKAQSIPASMTLEITAKVKQLKKEGKSIIGFTAGEPDCNTPEYIRNSAKEALDIGFTKYTPVPGTLELRQAICNKLLKDNGLKYEPTDVIVADGAKTAIYLAVYSLVDEGDEVIIPAPFWFSYEEQVKICGGKTVPVYTKQENGYKMTAKELENAITDKTVLLMLNSPCNPTGAVYSKEELIEISKVCEKYNLAVISDEIYEKLIYDNNIHTSIASLSSYMKENTVVINGFSKTYSMTGWRIGYLATNKKLASVISKVQGHTTSNACSFGQYACVTALNGGEDIIKDMVNTFDNRRKLMMSYLDKANLKYIKPEGAFYLFLNIEEFIGKTINGTEIKGSMDFANLLIDYGVALIPGLPFRADNYVRLSYAIADNDIKVGMERLLKFIKEIN